jgi:branched-chain amino acid transport system ATP-binding protein
MNATAALRTEGLSVRYGGVQALDGVDAAVAPGTLVGLIGPNGAGKTTFIDAVGGFTASTGRVTLEDQDVSGLRPHERARAGLGRTWQAADLFDDLTVRENLRVAAGRPSLRGTLWELTHGRQHDVDGIDTALVELGIEDLADRAADQLTQGQRKLVGVARALAGRPRVLCLDEPAAGLDTEESRDLGLRLRRVVDAGTAMLLVDHDMGLVLSVCDHVIVLDFGKVIARGAPSEVRQDHAVINAYLGGAAAEVEASR